MVNLKSITLKTDSKTVYFEYKDDFSNKYLISTFVGLLSSIGYDEKCIRENFETYFEEK